MIYAIVSDTDTMQNAVLAANLAASCAKEGRKVLLIEANLHMHLLLWTLRRYRREATLNFQVLPLIDGGLHQALQDHGSSYCDIVINVGATNSSILRTALFAANILIVPVTHQPIQMKRKEALKSMADTAMLFNPRLQMRLLAAGAPSAMPVHDYAAIVAIAENFPSGSVVAHPSADSADALKAFQRGLSIFEDKRADESEVRAMTWLCRRLCDCIAEKPLVIQDRQHFGD